MIFSKVCVTMALNLRIKYIIFTGVYLNQVRVVILIQVLNSFVSGIYAVALPLMMEERNIDIVTIGFLFASMPIVFQVLRMAVATVSDFWIYRLSRRLVTTYMTAIAPTQLSYS